jgi:hypothetical protein
MECLTPIKSREPITQGLVVSKFTWSLIAVALGAVVGGAALIDWRAVIDVLRRHPLLQAELAIFIGAFPGYTLSRGLPARRWARPKSLDRYYRTLVTVDPPPAAGYTHYLPCALLRRDPIDTSQMVATVSGGQAVASGILYAGPDGICFRPTTASKSRQSGPHTVAMPIAVTDETTAKAFEIGPVRMVTATAVKIAQPGQPRAPDATAEYAMLMEWPLGQALFAVPSIGDTLPRLHDCLDKLRWGNG